MPDRSPALPEAAALPWLRRIRLRHLEVLLTIARSGSLTAAASALDITQPAVSQWLADIESAAGVPLFERGRRLRPTPFAAPLLAHADRMVQDAHRAMAEVQVLRTGGSGRVRIGAMTVATAALVPAAVMHLREHAPGIELLLVDDIAAALWSQFERNEFDLLVTRLDARALSSGLQQRRLFQDPYRVVCGPQHPLARRKRVAWREVVLHPWLMPPAGTPLHGALTATFEAAGVRPPPLMLTSTSLLANIELLRLSDAIGVQSGTVAAEPIARRQLAALPLRLVHDTGHVGLLWREAAPGPALAAVLQAFVEVSKVARAPGPIVATSTKGHP